MKFIFHLGTYKTGTSSLQNFLYAHRDQLAARGICYPSTGLVESDKLGYRHRRIIEAINHRGQTNLLRKAMEEADAMGCQTVFLSCEAWSHPTNLSALTTAVHALKDFGVSRVEALVTFRNVVSYQVSHYREFTLNQRNVVPYADYGAARRPWINYVFLLQNFRTLFQDRLHVLHYESVGDSRVDILRTLGLEALTKGLSLPERANVKSLGALDVEAVRVAQELGFARSVGESALAALLQKNPSYARENWTERFEGDVAPIGPAYREEFQRLSGWQPAAIDALFDVAPVKGRNVAVVSEALMRHMKPPPPNLLQRGLRKIFRVKA